MKTDYEKLQKQLGSWSEKSAKAYETANDGQRPEETRDDFNALHLGYMVMVDQLCFEHDIKTDWPGLYPCFNWQGVDFHSVESLINWMKREPVAS